MDVTVDNPLKNDLKRRRQYVKHKIWLAFQTSRDIIWTTYLYRFKLLYSSSELHPGLSISQNFAQQWLKDEQNSNERRTVLPKIKAQDRELV